MDTIQKILFYFDEYQMAVYLSLIYLAVLGLTGLLLVLRRESLFGFVLTSFSKFSFIMGLALYSLWNSKAPSMLNNISIEGSTHELLMLDIFVFPIVLALVMVMLLLTSNLSKKYQSLETFYLITIVFSISMTILIYRFLGADNLTISKSYFTEVLYTPKSLFIHYLYFLIPLLFILSLIFKRIIVFSFDPIQAHLIKINVSRYNFLFYFLAGLIIAICMRVLGTYLVIICLLVPGYMSLLIGRRLASVIILTVVSAVLFGLTGFVVSFVFDHLPAEPILIITFCLLSVLTVLMHMFFHFISTRR